MVASADADRRAPVWVGRRVTGRLPGPVEVGELGVGSVPLVRDGTAVSESPEPTPAAVAVDSRTRERTESSY
ncbi:hypothetical protein C441_18327 [Haloferax sulfurifontis ATCC BAA-897]|uniref:Uncharacterized protein n=1 Tax=Haloferax sulfurifontis ATCC BAA-897 TaxID=662480 RepID=M0HW17_9EURY|nr:hypothetical protein C441_18327 [Haloferax sulfurifontis ATCC BAA-897]